jgi:hypothetical protein
MNQIQLLMMMLVFGGQGRGTEFVKRAAPAMLPDAAARVALIALAARKEQKQQDEANTTIIKQLVDTGLVKDADTMKAKAPALYAVFLGLPAAARDSIFPRLPPGRVQPADGSRKAERAAP